MSDIQDENPKISELYPLQMLWLSEVADVTVYDAILVSMGIDPLLIAELRGLEHESGDAEPGIVSSSPHIHLQSEQGEFDRRLRILTDAVNNLALPSQSKSGIRKIPKIDFLHWLSQEDWDLPAPLAECAPIRTGSQRRKSSAIKARLLDEVRSILTRQPNASKLQIAKGVCARLEGTDFPLKTEGSIRNALFNRSNALLKDDADLDRERATARERRIHQVQVQNKP